MPERFSSGTHRRLDGIGTEEAGVDLCCIGSSWKFKMDKNSLKLKHLAAVHMYVHVG